MFFLMNKWDIMGNKQMWGEEDTIEIKVTFLDIGNPVTIINNIC